MTRIDAARALQTLVRVYRRELSGDDINLYIDAWCDLDPKRLSMAIEQHVVYFKHFPTPGQIALEATGASTASLIEPALDAWARVVKTVKHQWWWHYRPRFSASVNVALDLMGGFRIVGNRIREHDLAVELEFVHAYEFVTGLRETLRPDQEDDSAP